MVESQFAQATDYSVDLVYPSSFVLGQTPLQLQWAAVTAGAAARPLTRPFSYCDLGCGDGSTLCLLAACYPQASFIGIDINPAHIELGRDRASRCGVDNVRFVHASFAELPALGLPDFDYIAAYGIYSWLDPIQQAAIDEFAAQGLAPGGLFAVHYSSLPGSAIRDPLCNYVRMFATAATSSTRIAIGLETMRRLKPVALFFKANPHAGEMLDNVEKYPPALVAHDMLNRQTHSFYCTEVHDRLAAQGLEYLASANVLPDYPELLLSRSAFAAYSELTTNADLPFRELIRDLMFNSAQRFDLFRKGGAPASKPGERLRAFTDLFLQRAGNARDLETRRQWSAGCAADLTTGICSAILDLAAAPAITLGDALASRELGEFAPEEVERAVEQLFALGLLNVLVKKPNAADYHSDRRYRLRGALNVERLRETLTSTADQGLASEVLGSPLLVPAAVRLQLMAFLGGDITPAWQAAGTPTRGTLEQFREKVRAAVPRFVRDGLPQLLRLGIVEEDS
jgi:SAM-dependent methyltransferase